MRATLALIVVAVAFVAVTAANAAAPQRQETTFTGIDVLTLRCGFPVLRAFEGRQVVLTWNERDGTVRQVALAPTFRVRLTNPATSKTIVVNASGPFFFDPNPDGSFVSWFGGPTFSVLNPETGELGLFAYSGRNVTEQDASGVSTQRFVGHVRDLCSELAAP